MKRKRKNTTATNDICTQKRREFAKVEAETRLTCVKVVFRKQKQTCRKLEQRGLCEMKTAQSLASVSPELVFINYFFLFFLSFYHIAAVDLSQVQLNLQAKTGRLSQFRANTLNQKEVEHRREVHAGVHSTVPFSKAVGFT